MARVLMPGSEPLSPRRRALRLRALGACSVLLGCAICRPASATEWYVAPSGDDQGLGTADSPFQTIGKGLDAVAAGDTLWILPGTYAVTSMVGIWQKSGTADMPITISGVLDQPRPVIDASGITSTQNGQNHGFSIGGGSAFVTLRHVAISGAKGHGISLWGASDIQILDCEVGSSQWNGLGSGAGNQVLQRIRVTGCWLHDNVLVNLGGANGSWGEGLALAQAEDSVVEGNLVERTSGEGIDIFVGANRCRVTANTVLDSYSVSLYLDHALNSTFERNFLRTLDPAYFRDGSPAAGIQIADETGSGPLETANDNNVFIGNVVVGTSVGFDYGAYGWGAGLRRCQLLQNTFVANQTSVIVDQADPANGSTTGNVLAGNAFLEPTNGQTYLPGGLTGLDFHENAWFGGTTDAAGPGDVTGDPGLGDITSASPFDLQPGPSSPLIDAAQGAGLSSHDFMAQERPQRAAQDIGAFEAIDETATVVTLPLPAGVTDPIRVFTTWDWGDGSEILTTIGVTSSHHLPPGDHTLTATIHDPVAGTDTVTATDIAVPTEGGTGCSCASAGSGGRQLGAWSWLGLGALRLIRRQRRARSSVETR